MTITNVKLHMINRPRLLAVACIELDHELIINDLRIVHGRKRIFVEFPRSSYGERHNMQIIVPLNHDARGKIEEAVLEKYERDIFEEYELSLEEKENENEMQ